MDDSADRLARLALILNDGTARRLTATSDSVEQHLASLRPGRIRQLAREIESRVGLESDQLDCVAMRLLLDELTSALAHLRAVAREAATGIERAPAALKDVRRLVQQQQQWQEKQSASTAPSD